RMQAVARDGLLARLNGDEFNLIIDGGQPEAAYALARRLQEAMDEEFRIDGKTARVSLTIGISLFPQNGRTAATLMNNADVARFRAKAASRGSICLFETEMDQQIRDRRALHQDLASAVRNGELQLHYQPLASIEGKGGNYEIAGFEALARWFH